MDQVPKIVTQRLQATAKVGAHPDPNLLTALVEKSLTERERVQVLEHIAQCSDCRDIVAISLPEFEMARVAATPRTYGWLSWRVLRWGAAAACVVVVGAAVSLHKRGSMVTEAPRAASAVEGKAAASTPPPSLTAQSAASSRDRAAASTTEKKLIANAAHAPISALRQPASAQGDLSASTIALSKEFGREGRAKSQEVAASPEPTRADNRPLAPPASRIAVAVAPGTKAGELDSKAERQNKQVDESYFSNSDQLADKAAPALEVAEGVAGKAKDTEQRDKSSAVGTAGGALVQNRTAARSASAQDALKSSYASNLVLPRWTLSADGTLQRSLDAGKTWQTIPVPGHVTFRALAAVGAEIWVGGAKGTLYYSSDAGEHWLQVKPVAEGKALTADIIGVEFTDARSGKLTTAGGEIWATTDAGQTWQSK